MTTFRKFWQDKPRTAYAEYFNDFLALSDFAAADWTATKTDTDTATETVSTAIQGGALVLTNSAADGDNDFVQNKVEAWGFTEGKSTEFETRVKVTSALNSALVLGLQITDTSPMDVSDGVFFRKSAADLYPDLVVCKNGVESVIALPDPLADDTFVTLGFYYDGTDTVQAMVNGRRVASLPIDNLPDDELLAISIGVSNGTAAANTLTVDYLRAVQQR